MAARFLISAVWAAEPTDTSRIQGDRGDCDIKGCWHTYVSQLRTKSAGRELIWSLNKPYPILTLTERWARQQRCHAYGCALQPHPHYVCKRLHDDLVGQE